MNAQTQFIATVKGTRVSVEIVRGEEVDGYFCCRWPATRSPVQVVPSERTSTWIHATKLTKFRALRVAA